ncbi:MAG: hypothetical protein OXC19_09140 [Bryobacterales bacterium]|nr:hypothetical protein [Bryobacterales bacterium]
MRVLGSDEIRRALPMRVAIAAMREAFVAHVEGTADGPPRTVLHTGVTNGATLVMPVALNVGDVPLLVVKVVSVFPANRQRNLASIHGTVIAVEAETGVPIAILDGASLTAIRTAAACGLATDLLARADSAVLAVFGSGVHARTQVEAVREVRSIEEVRIYNPNTESAVAMADELTASAGPDCGFRVADSAASALDGADIACTATTSRIPVFENDAVPDGLHINAIGSFHAADREIPGATVARAGIFVDDHEVALEEAGDLIIPIREGLIDADHILSDLGGLLLGRAQGRSSKDEVTFFKSVGLAVQDAAAAQAVLRALG